MTDEGNVIVLPHEAPKGVKLCGQCAAFYFPRKGSQEYRGIVAHLENLLSHLPDWQKKDIAWSTPGQWGVCKERNAMCHFTAPEPQPPIGPCFKDRKGGIIGTHLARDRRDP